MHPVSIELSDAVLNFNVNDWNVVDLPGDADANAHVVLTVPSLRVVLETPYDKCRPPSTTMRCAVGVGVPVG